MPGEKVLFQKSIIFIMKRTRMVPVIQEERIRLANRRRARALLEEHSNRVGEIIFARTKRIPKMNLVEGLPRNMAQLERQIQTLRAYKPRVVKNEGFKRHGPKFVELYELIAKSIGYKFGDSLTTKIMNKQYFPTAQIKKLIGDLRKEVQADPALDAKSRENALRTCKRFSQRTSVGQFLRSIIADREILLDEIKTETPVSAPEIDEMVARLSALKPKMPNGNFSPMQQAEIYLELYNK